MCAFGIMPIFLLIATWRSWGEGETLLVFSGRSRITGGSGLGLFCVNEEVNPKLASEVVNVFAGVVEGVIGIVGRSKDKDPKLVGFGIVDSDTPTFSPEDVKEKFASAAVMLFAFAGVVLGVIGIMGRSKDEDEDVVLNGFGIVCSGALAFRQSLNESLMIGAVGASGSAGEYHA